MEAVGADFVIIELIHQKIQFGAIVHKNQDSFCIFIQRVEQLTQLHKFLPLLADEIKMLDVRVHFGLLFNFYQGRVVHLLG